MGGYMPPVGQGIQSGTTAILDWLRQMAMGGGAQGGYGADLRAGGFGGMAVPPPYAPPPAAAMAPGAGVPGPAGVPPGTGPMAQPAPWDFSQGLGQMGLQVPPGSMPGSVAPGTGPMPQTKTEPRAPLQFAWGGGDPQNYAPGISDVLDLGQFPGAPSGGREGFMGAEPQDPMQAGGHILPPQTPEGQTDWGNVANPMGFESFQTAPGVEETIRSIQDPLWREKGAAMAAAEGQKEVFREQASLAEANQIAQESRLKTAIEEAVMEAQAAAAQAGEPFNEEDEDRIRYEVYQRFAALGGGGGGSPFGG